MPASYLFGEIGLDKKFSRRGVYSFSIAKMSFERH